MVDYNYDDEDLKNMKKRSLAGNVAIGFALAAFIIVTVAFSTPRWIVSDYRITNSKLESFGLWVHCFRSLNDQSLSRYSFVGCRWLYDPFTTGYDQIRGFLMPPFLIATQFFFTLCFVSVLIGAILTLLYFLCCGPDMKQYVLLIQVNAWNLLFGGLSGVLAVIIFGSLANRRGWMPGHDNNFFGWSFALGCIGAIVCLVAATLFFVDYNIQKKKRDQLKDSRQHFELERERKA